jgi:hypothetical protein
MEKAVVPLYWAQLDMTGLAGHNDRMHPTSI